MDATQKYLLSRNGTQLAVYDWPYLQQKSVRGAVLIVHTLGDYALRYQLLAQRLSHWGFAVRAFDFYGHDASDGSKGTLLHGNQFPEELADVAQDWRQQLPRDTPLIVLGYSMGATVAMQAQLQGLLDAQAFCLISPMLRIHMTWVQKLALVLFRYLMPDHVGPAHFSPGQHVRDAEAQLLLEHDSKWVRVMSVRLGESMFGSAAEVLRRAREWVWPSLLLYNAEKPPQGAVLPSGTDDFVMRSPANLALKRFDLGYPDLLHDADKQEVYTRLQQWLDRHYPERV